MKKLDDAAQEKADQKAQDKADRAEKADRTPQQALKDDWADKHADIGRFITKNGEMRGGLKPSDQEKAKEILKSYGF